MTELYWHFLLITVHLAVLASHGHCTKSHGNHHQKHATKRKSHDFFSGGSHLETLSWAVKLTFDPELYTKQELDMVADLVALETSLDNLGQIGEFKGHYYFVHKFHRDTTKHITDSYHNNHNKHNAKDNNDNNNNSNRHSKANGSSSAAETNTGLANELETYSDESTMSPETEERLQKLHQPSPRSNENLTDAEWWRVKEEIHQQLDKHQYVQWHMQQLVRSRQKRSGESHGGKGHRAGHTKDGPHGQRAIPDFNDKEFLNQWHLINLANPGNDINVTGVWELGLTGKGVTTAVIDDGLEWTNPDLRANYSPEGSWDLNSNDADPMPHGEKVKNHHGTRCAGEIAAVANNRVCGVGVAHGAKVAGIRVLDGPMTDSLEATAFMKGYTVNDVYSCSWGPDDDGKTVDGPHYLATRAMRLGVDYGRRGYGAIYVVASGNGGRQGDNCNYDGYANSIYTLTIGAVNEHGSMPYYAEECASMLAVTYSSGNMAYERSIVTTDWMKDGGTGCTDEHSGTSAAAPLAAGMIALMLEARPCLTWRDVQYLVVMTAIKVDVDLAHWYTNAAGLHHSHKHGFGLMNAWALVNAAKAWEPIPWMTVFTSEEMDLNAPILTNSQRVSFNYTVTKAKLDGYQLASLEYVQAVVTIKHDRRGDLEIRLRCPSGTESLLGASRPHDDSRDGFMEWTFSTVRCWGEEPQGTWTLIISDKGHVPSVRGHLTKWNLKLFGSPMTAQQVAERRRLVRQAADGHYFRDNITTSCPPPPLRNKMVKGLSERILKVLTLCSAFCLVMGVYQSFEYAFCYDDEKKDQYKLISLVKRARTMADQETRPTAGGSERECLLGTDTIPLHNMSPQNTSETSRLLPSEAAPSHSLSALGRELLNAQAAGVALPPRQDSSASDGIGQSHHNANSNTASQNGRTVQGARPKVTRQRSSAQHRNGGSPPNVHGSVTVTLGASEHNSNESSEFGELVSGWNDGDNASSRRGQGQRSEPHQASEYSTRNKTSKAKAKGVRRQ